MCGNVVTDVEKLKEKHSAKEYCVRNLISEVERLTAQQQKLQHELNAQVVSVGLLSADITRLADEIAVCLLRLFSEFYRHCNGQGNFILLFSHTVREI